MAQLVKNLSVIQETWIQSLGQEDSLEEGPATHSSVLDRRIPCTEEPGSLQAIELQRAGQDWMTNIFTFIYIICSFIGILYKYFLFTQIVAYETNFWCYKEELITQNLGKQLFQEEKRAQSHFHSPTWNKSMQEY